MFGKKKKQKEISNNKEIKSEDIKEAMNQQIAKMEALSREEKKKENEVKYKYVSDTTDYKVENKPLRNPLLGFKFWFFVIGAAILLTLGVWIMVDKNLGSRLSIGVTGAVILLLGILRVIPLFKGTKNPKTKFSVIAEILIEIVIGAFLFFVAFMMQRDGSSTLSNFVVKYYKYFLGIVLYLKAVFYFINTSLLGEDTYKLEFWTHIIVITIACMVFALNFDASSLGLFVGILCLLSGVAVGTSGGSSYIKYHKYNKKNKHKKDEKTEIDSETIILPNFDNDKERTIVQ